MLIQGDHFSGNPGKSGNIREFDSCHGNAKKSTKSQGNVREVTGKILPGKLFIVNLTFLGYTNV